ncbi:MAG TPA: potassium channel protein [Myxococcota bacterium]
MIRSRRLVLAVLTVLLVLVIGTLGNVLIVGLSPLDALFMTVITVSTIGYHELPPLDAAGKVFTMLLIVLGVGTTFYTLVALAEFLIEGRVRDLLGRRAMKRTISMLEDHVVLCGYGRFGRVVAQDLSRLGVGVVVIETNPAAQPALEASGHPFVIGSALDDAVLAEAGIARARAIVAATGSDADNVFIALSAREANPSIGIHARGESDAGIRRLQLAGAAQVVSPYHLGGQRIAHAIARPSVVDFITLATPAEGPAEISLEEVVVGGGSVLEAGLLRDLPARGLQLHVVAIKRPGEPTKFQPRGEDALRAGDRVVVVGDADNLRRIADMAGAR